MIDAQTFRRTMSRFPTFVAVITAMGEDGPVGCTATAVLSLSLAPPTLLVSLHSGGRTLADIEKSGSFAVNALSWPQRDLSARFAAVDPARRFDGVPHELVVGVPVLTGTAATAVCRLTDAVPALDHTLLFGRVSEVRSTDEDPMILLDGGAVLPEQVASLAA